MLQIVPDPHRVLTRAAVAIRELVSTGRYEGVSLSPPAQAEEFRDSSVLILLFHEQGQLKFLLTGRPEGMRTFPGLMVFPGGKSERGESSEKTALREFEEELGAHIPDTAILGKLDPIFRTTEEGRCFRICPVIGFVQSLPQLNPNPDEVEKVEKISVAARRPMPEGLQMGAATRAMVEAIRASG